MINKASLQAEQALFANALFLHRKTKFCPLLLLPVLLAKRVQFVQSEDATQNKTGNDENAIDKHVSCSCSKHSVQFTPFVNTLHFH